MKRVSLPLRIAAWYGLFGLIWIFLSDWLVGRIGLDAAQLQTIQTLKGSVFVLASVAFVYVVAHLEGNKTDAARTAAERAFRLLEEALGIANTAAFMFDRRTSQFELSAGVRRVLGLANAHARIDWNTWLDRVHRHDRAEFEDSVAACLDHGTPLDIAVRVRHENGSHRWIRVQAGVIAGADGTPTHVTGTLTDISELKFAHDEVARTVSLVRALTRANHATVTAGTEADLFQQVCAALTEEDAYSLAWIVLTGEDAGSVSVTATRSDGAAPAAGWPAGPVELDAASDPIRQAIASNVPVHRDDAWAEPALAPWRHGAGDGPAGCLLVPFGESGTVAGVLAVFGDLPSNFDATARIVLANVGEDIGFALTDLRRRERLSRAEQERDEGRATLTRNLFGAVKALALTVEMRDPYTAGHQLRVSEFAVAIAGELGLGESEIDDIRLGAMIHDIGKIYVPTEILTRPGKLSPEELGLIRQHASKGAEIVAHVGLSPTVTDIVLHHHERLDGSGYPDGLSGEDVSRAVRIVAVADVIEATAAHRPYRPANGLKATLQLVREARGISLDAAAVDAACDLLERQDYALIEASPAPG